PRPPCPPLSPYTTLFRSQHHAFRFCQGSEFGLSRFNNARRSPDALKLVWKSNARDDDVAQYQNRNCYRSPNSKPFGKTHVIFIRSEEHTSELQSRENLVC